LTQAGVYPEFLRQSHTTTSTNFPTANPIQANPGRELHARRQHNHGRENFYGTLTVPVKVNDGALDSNTFQLELVVNPDPQNVKSRTKVEKEQLPFEVK